MKKLNWICFSAFIVLHLFTPTEAVEPLVERVEPSHGSLFGGTRITISGKNFADSQFSFGVGNENVGSKVDLVSDLTGLPHECIIHKDGCHKTQITCYTPKLSEGDYYVRVSVDGVKVPIDKHCPQDVSKCKFQPSEKYTPTITNLYPTTGMPGTLIRISGKVVTDRFGSNIQLSSNGLVEKLLRIYLGSRNCEVKDLDKDAFYSLQMDGEKTLYGHIDCKGDTIFIGNMNASFIVEGGYGRSRPDKSILKVSSDGKIYMYQQFTSIDAVSPAVGSVMGGTKVTLTGNYFDNTIAEPIILIDDTVCEVKQDITKTEIVCNTAVKPSTTKPTYKGNRGLKYEIWNSTTRSAASLTEFQTLLSSAADYYMKIVDEANLTDTSNVNYVSRMSGFFIAPLDSQYRFYAKGDNNVVLYLSTDEDPANMEKLAESGVASTYWKNSAQQSKVVTLQKGKSYYMEILHRAGSSTSKMQVAARAYQTRFTNSMTGVAVQEKQKISVTSTVRKETQVIKVQSGGTKSAKASVQTVTVSGSSSQYRLGLHGAYTEPLTTATSADSMKSALEKLPSLSPSTVSVTQSGLDYIISFNTERGDLPLLTYKKENPDLSVSVVKTTAGEPSLNYFNVGFDGIASPDISVGATAKEVEQALTSLFSVRCPDDLGAKGSSTFFQGFEDSVETKFGTRVSDEEPFCGMYSAKNPNYLFIKPKKIGVNLLQFSHLCFAYRGEIVKVQFAFSYLKSDNSGRGTAWASFTVPRDAAADPKIWSYHCEDIAAIAKQRNSNADHRIDLARIIRKGPELFVDSVRLAREADKDSAGVNDRRMPPAKPNGFRIKTVEVTSAEVGTYTVVMTPFNCGYDLPLFSLEYGKVTSGSISKTSSSADFSLSNGGTSLTVQVTRDLTTGTATPPVGGDFKITFEGKTTEAIPAYAKGDTVADELKALSTIGEISVERNGDCANFDYELTWITQAGDLNPITVDSSLTGNVVAVAVTTLTDGSVWFDPIMGDMLQTPHPKPQIRAYINKIPTACSGDCSYEWLQSATPTITGVNPSSGMVANSIAITITGTGFDSTPANNTVSIGGVACTVTAATATTITCNIGNGPTGSHAIVVDVAGKGLASGSVTFSYLSAITSISPTSGSIGGGTTLTITGYGFTSDAVPKVNNVVCKLTTTPTPSQIICITPPSTSSTTVSVDVTVSQASSELTSPTQFEYNLASTAIITQLSTMSSSVEGGNTLTITGTGLGASPNPSQPVTIGGNVATVTSYSDTAVVVTLPSNPPGSYPVLLQIGTNGYADRQINSIGDIVYDLKVTNIYPDAGSLYGGTKVTLSGVGFSTNTTLNEVKFGKHVCDVESATTTKIVCTIRDTGEVHHVTNKGSHPVFGYLYGWDPSTVEVKVGDYVQFSWTLPSWVNDRGYGINQTKNASTTELMPDGFSTGPSKTANGNYKYRFSMVGTYYYWSGWVDEYETISLKGSVTVVDKTSHTQLLKLTVAGHEAVYQPGGADPSPAAVCPGTVADIPSCSVTKPADLDASKFNFKFWSCRSPVITNIDRINGSTTDDITLTGTGFSATSCHHEITVGDGRGMLQTSSATSLVFRIDSSTSPSLGIYNEIRLRVGNLGYALVQMKGDRTRRFALIPVVESITPLTGSTAGKTELTVTGFGFSRTTSDIQFEVGGALCTVQSMTYTQVVCLTPPAIEPKEVNITFRVSSIPAQCKAQKCKFTYSLSMSPKVTEVVPTSVSTSPTSLTITGKLFGTDSAAVAVDIGGQTCTLTAVSDTTITCDISNIPVGSHLVKVVIAGKGLAITTATVNSVATISSLSPTEGSVHGGLELTINGNGFVSGKTSVTVDGSPCTTTSVTATIVKCITLPHAAGAVTVVVTANGHAYPPDNSFSYTSTATPTITTINPTSGLQGDSVTIIGTGFSADNSVSIGGATCTVTSETSTQIVCTLGPLATGEYSVKVKAAGKGSTSNETTFEYSLSVSSYTPNTGSTAGGQAITISGSGFEVDATMVTVCGNPCTAKTGVQQTSSQYICLVPPGSAGTACDVIVTVNGLSRTLTPQYTYDSSLTPEITLVDPRRGGTGGGTTVTITGTGFGTTDSAVQVTIGGATCVVTPPVTDTQITCVTGSSTSQKTSVRVEISGNGIATQTSASFEYVDVWSSRFSWGNQDPPADGDFVVVPKGQTLLLDVDTNVLKMLLIRGGKLVFDNKDVELKAENILIVDGGTLQVGTREVPFQHKGIITMYGHLRSPELPLYGAKTIAVRNGTLDLHGKFTPITWTRLAATADAGSSMISLQKAVNWEVDDEIVIATTSHRHSQKESEVRKITNISGDKLTLTLDTPLSYKHLGISETYNGVSVDFRAEVGLLTHNVVVRGNKNLSWSVKVPACPDGFDTGEFTTQTCFQGRFGEELGSDEFGAMIMIHSPERDEQSAQAHISYTEITHAGQAFRLGRYPIHFHRNGNMSESYVIGCGIHHTFNRAVNVHDSINTLVAHNVIYDIRGGAFFLEDGIETDNTFEYNLGVFVRASTSLLNDDVTPATFWVTNPNNIIQHNAAAGGTHFGYWYRMEEHPTGPSATASICPRNVPLGVFQNNTAHSMGWFGLWIFEFYFPMDGDDPCTSSVTKAAVFKTLTAWNCEKGVEAVNVGALQFHDFILVNNDKAGYEGKLINNVPQYEEANSPMVKGGIIVGHTSADIDGPNDAFCTSGGIVLPYGNGMLVKDVYFENFNTAGCSVFRWTRITGTCSNNCGGFLYKVSGLRFQNSPNKAIYDWVAEGILEAIDTSLTGTAGDRILPNMATLPQDQTICADIPEFGIGIPAKSCKSSVRFHRFAFNDIEPESLLAKNVLLRNEHGETEFSYRLKRITHKHGWMTLLVDGQDYTMTFKDAQQLMNISYSSTFYQFSGSDYITMTVKADKPDRFEIGGTHKNESTAGFTSTDESGSWQYNETAGTVKYLVSSVKRVKRASIYEEDRVMNINVYRCYYRNCIKPPHPSEIKSRPDDAVLWSSAATWSNRTGGKPVDGDDVTIPVDKWIVVDEALPKMGKLIIEGGLEFKNGPSEQYLLSATYIYITGHLVIGWPHEPYTGKASIVLRGSHTTPQYVVDDGPVLGSKFMAVFGGLDLHGKDVGVVWTRLATTALPGSRQITLADSVNWEAGDEIVITTTSYNAWHTETFSITGISGKTLTLNETLKYKHIEFSETLATSQTSYSIAAEVGLLSRNIKIIGDDYDRLFQESFGARVIVARTSDETMSYSGVAKIQNVEFDRSGQEGFVAPYDARYSLTFMDVMIDEDRMSYVRKNAFHNGFSPAIGSYSTNGLIIEENVIHHTVGPGIVIHSESNNLTNNLVTLSIWPGSYQDRREIQNILYEGGIEAMHATNIIMRGNVVAGSERAGIRYPGEACDAPTTSLADNTVHGSLSGVAIFPKDKLVSSSCVRWSNFFVWKNLDWGLYINNGPSVEIEDIVSVENGVGVFTMVVGPGALSHDISQDKYVKLRNSTFVGKTSSYDCVSDVKPSNDDNIQLSGQGRSWGNGTHGKVGFSMAVFTSGGNLAPEKPFYVIMAYQALKGIMKVSDVVFARFGASCGNSEDYAITTDPGSDDGSHPLETSRITFDNDVNDNNKLYYHIPNVNKINPSDCVDMDCDALHKCLLKDMDGSFLGSSGAVIPVSEFQWNGDPRRGLGDYRIPKVLLTAPDGSKLDANVVAPHKGVIRDNQCMYKHYWRGYECHNLDYEMLIIESMDSDTETRRLSPVAILGEGYLDLINGPQDHGWCSGYTCRKRLSTFQALVATGKSYDIYFTSTTPQTLRLYMINADSSQAVRVSIWYARPNRLDVKVDGNIIMAKNAEIRKGKYFLNAGQTSAQYMPDVATEPAGTNFINRQTRQIFVIVKGDSVVNIETNEQIIVSFSLPAMTVDDFFGDNIIENLAAFLNVDPRKVRIVDVVNEQTGSGRRRRRTVATTTVVVEIGDEPGETGSGSLTYSQLQQLQSQIVLLAQTGSYDSIVNATVLGVSLVEVVPSVESSEWGQITVDETPVALTKAGQMTVHETPVPSKEGQTFTVPIRLRVVDTDGAVITNLGTTIQPWQVTATLVKGAKSDVNATLTGTTTVSFSDGWANFTDLVITHAGSEYGIDLAVTSPSEAANFTVAISNITVLGRQLTAYVASLMDDAVEDAPVNISLGLKDYETNELISDITWRGHSWTISVCM
ncbi:fibrocystin-L-like isoform X2 [Gigantopelta aegis]|uniref:fibrocystin-L-like isoform X2 n=1 Tax=Gigantopelta aegis TaxID=1735272 RepID=UPI001B88C74E|nr:fibrocystin-L-like isoform X2 [Gigantopelta aegis]